MSESITSNSSRKWISEHELSFKRYLRSNHKEDDFETVIDLVYRAYPDEGKKLIVNHKMSTSEKIDLLIKWIIHSSQITCLIFGDQNMGKDALICKVFELIIDYCKKNEMDPPRFVTLGNIKRPWFVDRHDRYFSLMKIPVGTKSRPVYIYSSELDAVFPARDFQGEENKLFSVLQNTFRQNHQKIFGCVKLGANVDISVLRTCNLKLFKYISPEKLEIKGIERDNLLSKLGRWFLPKDIKNKAHTLMAFDNNLLTCEFPLPSFWSDDYSEQYGGVNITDEDVKDFIRDKFDAQTSLTPAQIRKLQIMVYSIFRKEISGKFIKECFDL